MKKLYAVVFLLLAGVIFVAVWFSPLARLGTPYEYADNAPVGRIDGVCYAQNALVRVDFDGDEDSLYAALRKIDATTIKTVYDDDMLIVYAYSPRVAAEGYVTDSGERYNVMAAAHGGVVSIGAPILSGCY